MPLTLRQAQDRLRGFNSWAQGTHQAGATGEVLIGHTLTISRGQHAAQLPSPSVACLGAIARGCQSGGGATRHAAQIAIQEVRSLVIVVPIALSVLAIDGGQGRRQLSHSVGGAGIQGIRDGRLVGTRRAPKRLLQGHVAAQTGGDRDQTVHAGQDGDERSLELGDGRLHNRLLGNAHLLPHRFRQLDVAQMAAEGGQTGARRKRRRVGGKLSHDGPPVLSDQPWNRYGPCFAFSRPAGPQWQWVTNWGQN